MSTSNLDDPNTPWDDAKRSDMEKWFKRDEKLSRGLRFLLALDQMFNVILWNGSHNETISSHVGRRLENNEGNWFDKLVCKVLGKLENKHCKKSIGE